MKRKSNVLKAGLTVRQVLVADMIAAGSTNGKAAQANGVSERTIARWINQPEFRAYLQEKVEKIDQERLDRRYEEAFRVVDDKLHNAKNEFAQLQAAGMIINAKERMREKDQSISVIFSNAPMPVQPKSNDLRLHIEEAGGNGE